MGHSKAVFDRKRKRLISNALKLGYRPEHLCEAISGCALTPHNIGHNDRGERYDGLQVILRDADQIERFMRNYHNPPRPLSRAEREMQQGAEQAAAWVAEQCAKCDDGEKNVG